MADENDVKAPERKLSEENLATLRDAYAAWYRLTPERRNQIERRLFRPRYSGIDDPMIFDNQDPPERPPGMPEPSDNSK